MQTIRPYTGYVKEALILNIKFFHKNSVEPLNSNIQLQNQFERGRLRFL